MTKTVLVTGANGLLGAQCVTALAKDSGWKTIAVWHQAAARLQANPPANLLYVKCDLTDPEAVRQLFQRRQIDAVLHTAVLLPDSRARYEERSVMANVMATVNLVAAARDTGCPRFVFCSSVSVYGATEDVNVRFTEEDQPSPGDIYAWSKLAGEQYLELSCSQSAMRGFSLRLSGLHGPGREGGIFYGIIRAAKSGVPIQIASAAPFQFLHLHDAVKIALLALDVPGNEITGYTTLNVASAMAPSLQDIATRSLVLSGLNSPIVVSDTKPPRQQIMTTEKMQRMFNFQPHDVDKTIQSVLEWLGTPNGGAQ